MDDELLSLLKDYVEGRLSKSEWRAWWAEHAAEVEARCDRFTYLRLKLRSFRGAMAILEARGVKFFPRWDICPHCDAQMFVALPGETSVEEVRAFARSTRLPGWESIVRDGWIHPGRYCSNGCTMVMMNIR